jgi:16S rRNA (guanine(527)-N(7))-methyltransferase RsmG
VEHARRDPLDSLLGEALARLDQPPSIARRLRMLAELVARWAERINLTGHRGAEEIARRLVVEALALGAALPVQPPISLVDLGSGAGFPGLPLAILWPACRVTLVESRERKHHFQRTAIRELELANVTAVRGRAEGIEPTPSQIVLAQAMAHPARSLEWMRRWAEPGGWLVLPRAARAARFDPPAGARIECVREYQVPLGGPSRSLWVARVTVLDG